MDKISDLKFIVPPTLFLGFIFIINPYFFLCLFENFDSTLTIFAGTSIILALGFIISSLTCFIINISGHPYKEYERKEYLKRIFRIDEDDISRELAEWKKEGEKNDFVQKQILKKWEMAMVNFNSFIALLFSFLFGLCLYRYNSYHFSNSIPFYQILLGILLMILFFCNGLRAYFGLYDLEHEIMTGLKIQKEKNKRPYLGLFGLLGFFGFFGLNCSPWLYLLFFLIFSFFLFLRFYKEKK